MPTPSLLNDGAEHFPRLIGRHAIESLRKRFDATFDDRRPGTRLAASDIAPLPLAPLVGKVAQRLGIDARPVRALFFDKSEEANWALGWHQDRVIAVAERHDVPGFTNWTVKDGVVHVSPPPGLQARMLTARVHLDDVDEGNAPLVVAPGSHKTTQIAEAEIEAVVARCGTLACLAEAGDVWLYATPILHSSNAATRPGRRRVLQLDYAAFDLPGGLRWAFDAPPRLRVAPLSPKSPA